MSNGHEIRIRFEIDLDACACSAFIRFCVRMWLFVSSKFNVLDVDMTDSNIRLDILCTRRIDR